MKAFNLDEFKHFVPVTKKLQEEQWKLMDYLSVRNLDNYMILYNHTSHTDGEWHTGPQTTPVFVVFKNQEDAVEFRLKIE